MLNIENWQEWQKPYQYGTLVIWPPDSLRSSVNSQRERVDPLSQSYCEAHISVTQPFGHDPSPEDWEMIRKVLRGFNGFEIRFGPLNSFLPYPCIWYEIQPAQLVVQIRNALHATGLFNLEMKHPENFIPHMTITEGLSGPEVNEALLEELQRQSGQGTFICEELSYIIPDASFHFKPARVLPLGWQEQEAAN